MNPSKVNFDQEKIRSDLIHCLQKKKKKKKKKCNFPFNIFFLENKVKQKKKKKKKKKKTKTKEYIYCMCRGQYDSEMVQCGTMCDLCSLASPPIYQPTHSETNRREQEICL